MTRSLLPAACGLALVLTAGPAAAESPLTLTLVAKKEAYAWPYEKGPKEFEAQLKDLMKKKNAPFPKPPAVDLVLQITNTGKEKTTVYVDGDANTFTFTVKDPGVVTVNPLLAFTTDFRLPKAVELEPGKSHEIKIQSLTDGFRRASRYVYPTAPGEYSISAAYQLSTADGGKGVLLTSGEAKIKIAEPR